MKLFYATGSTEKGQGFVIYQNETFTNRITARKEAERVCKQRGLKLDGVYPVGRQETNGTVLTKYAKARKKVRHN